MYLDIGEFEVGIVLAGRIPLVEAGLAEGEVEGCSSQQGGSIRHVLVLLQGQFQGVSDKVGWLLTAGCRLPS